MTGARLAADADAARPAAGRSGSERYVSLAVDAAAACLPAGRGLPELYGSLAGARPVAGVLRWFTAGQPDLPPVEVPVAACGEPPGPVGRPVRLTGLSRESRMAVCVAAEALGPDLRGDRVGVVWVSSTAGLAEYAETCVAAATLSPGQASPLAAPLSGYAGPASAVSIRLGLAGPLLALTGDRAAGATAIVEAARLLAEGQCRHVLVGGSAVVDRWRLPAVPGSLPAEGAGCLPAEGAGCLPAEGAGCLLLSRRATAGTGVGVRPLRRASLRGLDHASALSALRGLDHASALSAFLAGCMPLMAAAPAAVALSAPAGWTRPDGYGRMRCWWVERNGGDLGAAGGFQAVMAAVAGCASGLARVLAVAVGPAGDAVAIEVSSDDAAPAGIPEARPHDTADNTATTPGSTAETRPHDTADTTTTLGNTTADATPAGTPEARPHDTADSASPGGAPDGTPHDNADGASPGRTAGARRHASPDGTARGGAEVGSGGTGLGSPPGPPSIGTGRRIP